jgi:phosphoribosylamine---glycine ligase
MPTVSDLRSSIMLFLRRNHLQVSVLIVGGGGREHALAWKLGQSPQCSSLYCAPGNPGIAVEPNVTTVPDLSIIDHNEVVSFCKDNRVGLVLVGPEAPLVDGLVDSLEASGVPTFGPTKGAAKLEGSKAFMKELCRKYDIPTAQSAAFESVEAACAYIAEQGAPIVVKASGLAAGKGVILAETVEDAQKAAADMLEGGKFGSAGKQIVVEEFLTGEEASYFALLDGASMLPLGSAQDHKPVYDGDKGPNTGGMGAYSPAPVVTAEIEAQVCHSTQHTALNSIVVRLASASVCIAGHVMGNLFEVSVGLSCDVLLIRHRILQLCSRVCCLGQGKVFQL